ncbi:hypothetical protein [Microlunatus antarcticus]|uniref:Lipoprotein n=1 Tax=Microlunatus antarcticus TaxID=53388 RepID=A0A7W5JZ84_9ACTN|nr:hypothetical protein [Microlunatus antarcticus]MBB3329039.1 hypothetical protein [Microlunatus antarcticus]
MRHWFAGRGLLVGSCLLAFVGTACTPSGPPPTPPTTVASATPTENVQEREERLAYQAAEASYREFRAEVERVYSRGGAAKPTSVMKATAGGQYLASYQEVSEAYLGLKHRSKGELRIDYVHRGGFSPSELVLDVCEDGRGVVTYDRKGKKLYTDDVRKLSLTARPAAGTWKIWTGKGEKASSCD